MVFQEEVSVYERFFKNSGSFAQNFKASHLHRPLACIPQVKAPQMSISSETVPMAIRARAVPVPMEVWGT